MAIDTFLPLSQRHKITIKNRQREQSTFTFLLRQISKIKDT